MAIITQERTDSAAHRNIAATAVISLGAFMRESVSTAARAEKPLVKDEYLHVIVSELSTVPTETSKEYVPLAALITARSLGFAQRRKVVDLGIVPYLANFLHSPSIHEETRDTAARVLAMSFVLDKKEELREFW